jgi:hypothetical protein
MRDMQFRFAPWILVAALGSGCSLLLDTGDLPQQPDGPPDPIDADPPDAFPVDANFLDFAVDSADPVSVIEGAGAKGMPVVLRFYGRNIIEPTVTAAWSDGFADEITVVDYHASNTFDEVAVALRVPVRPDLDMGACNGVSIHFDFMQAGAATDDEIDVALDCLNELTDITMLDSSVTYSRIAVTANRHFAPGSAAPVLRAVEDIRIAGILDVDAAGQAAGAGSSCNGGVVGGGSSCTGGGAGGAGGMALTHGEGGGGGGYFTDGGGGAAGGDMHGNAMLVPLAMAGTDGNHGSGGGGGGQVLLGSAGVGGGGGGTISLIAGGEIVVAPGALINAGGGRGGNAGGNALTGSGGSGGGGSGGAILVRAGAGVRFELGVPIPWLSTPRGLPGTPVVNVGGAGADGRTRVDQPLELPLVGLMVATGGSAAGPAWDPETPALVTQPMVSARLRGQAGSYGVINNDVAIANGTGGNVTIVAGSVPVMITDLDRGHNRICALYAPIGAANADREEARTCIDVVYVPAQ